MKNFNATKLISVLLVILMAMTLFSTTVLAEEATEETTEEPSVAVPGSIFFAGAKLSAAPTIDGDITEDAWASGWKEMNGENGFWQNATAEGEEDPDLICQYNIKWDDNGLYFAAVLNAAPVNNTEDEADYQTTATNIRFWLYDGSEEVTKFTHIYDFNYAEDGTVTERKSVGGTDGLEYKGSKTDSTSSLEVFIPYSLLASNDVSTYKFWLSVSAPGLNAEYDTEVSGDEGYNALNLNTWNTDFEPWSSNEGYFTILPDLDYITFDSSVDGFNRRIAGEDNVIFTSEIGDAVTSDNGNINWATAVVAEKDSESGDYVVSSVVSSPGAEASIDMPDDGFILAIHSDSVQDNKYQKRLAMEIEVGDVLKLTGIDLENAAFEDGAKIEIVNKYSVSELLLDSDEEPAEESANTSEAPSTGDSGVIAMIVLLALSAGGAVVVRKVRG